MDQRIDLTENFDFRRNRRSEGNAPFVLTRQGGEFRRVYVRGKLVKVHYPWNKLKLDNSYFRGQGFIKTGTKEEILREKQQEKWEKETYETHCECCGKEIRLPWERRYLLCVNCDNDLEERMDEGGFPLTNIFRTLMVKKQIKDRRTPEEVSRMELEEALFNQLKEVESF